MNRLDPSMERRIVRYAEQAVELARDGEDPTSAVLKTVKSATDVPAALIRRVCHAVNSALQVSAIKSTKSAADPDDFDLVNADYVISKLYGDEEKPEEKAASFVPPKRGTYVRSSTETGFAKQASVPSAPSLNGNPAGLYSKLLVLIRSEEQKAAHMRADADYCDHEYRMAAKKLHDYLLTRQHLISDLDKCAGHIDQDGVSVFEDMWSVYEMSKVAGIKRASDRISIGQAISVGSCDQTAAAMLKHAAEKRREAQKRWRVYDEFTGELQTIKKQARNCERALFNLPEHVDEDTDLLLPTKLAEEPDTVMEAITRPFKSMFSSVTGLNEDPDPKRYLDMLDDPQQAAEIKALDNLTTLHEIVLNDDVLKNHDPNEVIHLYNQIVHLVPSLAGQPVVLRGLLRKVVNQGGVLEPFEASQIADIGAKTQKSDLNSLRQELSTRNLYQAAK